MKPSLKMVVALGLVLLPIHCAVGLTAAEQADLFQARGAAAAGRGDLHCAHLCYTLALRAQPGYQAATAGLKALRDNPEVRKAEAEVIRKGLRAFPISVFLHGPLSIAVRDMNLSIQKLRTDRQGENDLADTWSVEIDENTFRKGELTTLPLANIGVLANTNLNNVMTRLTEATGTSYRVERLRIIIHARPKLPVAVKPPAPGPAGPLTWRSKDGRTIQAEFVGLDGEAVVVRKNGKEVTIPFANLDPASVKQARDLANRTVTP